MEDYTMYTYITESTATGARDRVLDALNDMTNGNADKAIKYVAEFNELEKICNEFKTKKADQK